MMHQSIATIQSPQFINLQPLDINPLMSKCEIKVLYLGKNRNGTFISKEVATEMAKTLRGAPIVGYYKEQKEDFHDHGQQVIIDDEGIKFACQTTPYGFVSPDAQVWFQMFEEQDGFGETVIREYLMTTGYLWTTQFPEAQLATTQEGRPQSMELDEETLKGSWESDSRGMEFFIINDAVFSKLCILGEDVEPCFEGASVKAPDVSINFSLMEDSFKNTLYTMMQQLQFALQGGQNNMENVENIVDFEDNSVQTETVEIQESTETTENTEFTAEAEEAPVIETVVEETPEVVEVPAEGESPVEEAAEEVAKEIAEEEESPVEEEAPVIEVSDKYAELETNYNELSARYTALETQYNELLAYKESVESEKKDTLINKFTMLSDEEKKDVVDNKATYSLEEIESKLSVLCFRKQQAIEVAEVETTDAPEAPAYTYSVSESAPVAPAWIAAVKNTQNNRNK